MNLISFIEKYGNLSFNEKKFSNIDAIILAELSYLNFEICAPKLDEPKRQSLLIKDIPGSLHKKLCHGEFLDAKNSKLLTLLKTSFRYQNIGIKYVVADNSKELEKQFYAVTFELTKNLHYIAFRGTDLILYSWKEDLSMAFLDKIPAQDCALKYVKTVTKLFKGDYFIGGHSKGGNLAFYAALNLTPKQMERCLKVYSFDGQGFNKDTKFNENKFKIMSDKLLKFVPENTFVGIMLNSITPNTVIKSDKIGIFQHDPFSWKVNLKTSDFIHSSRTKQSFINEKTVHDWTNSLNKDETVFIVNVIFNNFGELDHSLVDLAKKPIITISNLFKVHYNYSKAEKNKIKSILKRLIYYYKEAFKFYSSKEGIKIRKQLKEKHNA